jgi:phage tail P2-like protein
MFDLLPWNATPQERALSEAVARVSDVPAPLRDLWNADDCPPQLLAWLAWAFSVDQWDSAWTDAQKRDFIKSSVEVHRYKGTIGAVREALAALQFDAQVQEWFAQSPAGDPYTFRALLNVDQVGISQAALGTLIEVIERTKNLRSHLSEVQVIVRSVGGPYVAAAASLGSEINLTHYVPPVPFMVLNENIIVI